MGHKVSIDRHKWCKSRVSHLAFKLDGFNKNKTYEVDTC